MDPSGLCCDAYSEVSVVVAPQHWVREWVGDPVLHAPIDGAYPSGTASNGVDGSLWELQIQLNPQGAKLVVHPGGTRGESKPHRLTAGLGHW